MIADLIMKARGGHTNELVAFIEVKRVATKLSTRRLRQVEMYAVNEGVEWISLTNRSVWQVYHITRAPSFCEPVWLVT
jgi:predicted type IV restriction endonuclease